MFCQARASEQQMIFPHATRPCRSDLDPPRIARTSRPRSLRLGAPPAPSAAAASTLTGDWKTNSREKRPRSQRPGTASLCQGPAQAAADPAFAMDEHPTPEKMFIVKKRTANRNNMLQCTLCGEEMWHSHAKKHIAKRHPDKIGQYEAAARSKSVFSGSESVAVSTESKSQSLSDALDRAIARFVVTSASPLATVENAALKEIVHAAIAVGRVQESSRSYSLPNRTQLIDKVLSSKGGLLKGSVGKALERLEKAKPNGACLVIDNVNRIDGRLGNLVVVRNNAGTSALLWSDTASNDVHSMNGTSSNGATTSSKHEAGDISKVLTSIFSSEEKDDQDARGDGSTKRRKVSSMDTQLSTMCAPLANWACKNVFAVGASFASDSATSILTVLEQLEKKHAVISFGFPTEAMIRCLGRIMDIADVFREVNDKSVLLAQLFSDSKDLRELLLEQSSFLFEAISSNVVIALSRILDLLVAHNTVIRSAVDSGRLAQIKSGADAKMHERCSKAESILSDNKFWIELKLVQTVVSAFVTAIGILERNPSLCLVYSSWRALWGTIKQAFAENTLPDSSLLLSTVRTIVFEEWALTHFPVYSAGFVLTPHFRSILIATEQSESGMFKRLLNDTFYCLRLMLTRFDEKGEPRQSLNAKVAQEQVDSLLRQELADYLAGRDKFSEASLFSSETLSKHALSKWWEQFPESALGICSARLCSLTVASDKVSKDFREIVIQKLSSYPETSADPQLARGLECIWFEELMAHFESSKASNEASHEEIQSFIALAASTSLATDFGLASKAAYLAECETRHSGRGTLDSDNVLNWTSLKDYKCQAKDVFSLGGWPNRDSQADIESGTGNNQNISNPHLISFLS